MSVKKSIGIDLSKVEKLYTDSLEKHGLDPKSVGWRDTGSQEMRFYKLAQAIEASTGPITVNELGCGYGVMFNYLLKAGFDLSAFRGYDISPKMLEAAKGFVTDKRASFVHGERLDKTADYSFTSGIFNVKFDFNEADWIEHVLAVLRNMNEFSAKGFSFNLLSTYVDYKEPHLYYGDPLFYFDFCKKNFSKKVALLHDYPLWEWTIVVKK